MRGVENGARRELNNLELGIRNEESFDNEELGIRNEELVGNWELGIRDEIASMADWERGR